MFSALEERDVKMTAQRITVALDNGAGEVFRNLETEFRSKSELFRRALHFYSEHRKVLGEHGVEKIQIWIDALSKGEYVILDLDYWILFLKFVEKSPYKDEFRESCKAVGRSFASRLSSEIHSVEEFLKRVEACNFYRLNKIAEDEFVLIPNSDFGKMFIKNFIYDVLTEMGYKIKIDENMSRLRVRVEGHLQSEK